MNANTLTSRMNETQQVTFSFGKDGWGLPDEFISLEERITNLMEENRQLRKEIDYLNTPKQKA